MTKNKLWGGRFNKPTNKLVEDFTKSIQFDKKLAKFDLIGSLVHIDILKDAGLLTTNEHSKLKKGLHKILGNLDRLSSSPDTQFEDIHSYIQHLLEQDKSVGEAAKKLHTCRSRNDQVALDVKLYCLSNIEITRAAIFDLSDSLLKLVMKNSGVYLPGYTHLQHAIPVSLADYLGAYDAMLARDSSRFAQIAANIKLTFGAGALAGTMIPIGEIPPSRQRIVTEKCFPDRKFTR
jgi:argininosuccinate lyase